MKYIAIVIMVLISSGCALSPVTIGDLEGEWRFTYVQKGPAPFGMNPTPPSFDIITFQKDGSVRLSDSMMNREFIGDYKLVGNILTWRFLPPDIKQPVEHRLECAWSENGKALMLRIDESGNDPSSATECIYYQPSRLLPNDIITGKWIAAMSGSIADITFENNGKYYMDGKNIWGYYRLWPSRFGNTLTTSIWVQGEGGFMLLYLYNVDSDTLTLTPLTGNGPEKQSTVVWHRAKETPGQIQ